MVVPTAEVPAVAATVPAAERAAAKRSATATAELARPSGLTAGDVNGPTAALVAGAA